MEETQTTHENIIFEQFATAEETQAQDGAGEPAPVDYSLRSSLEHLAYTVHD